jgi:hypothetical protein
MRQRPYFIFSVVWFSRVEIPVVRMRSLEGGSTCCGMD